MSILVVDDDELIVHLIEENLRLAGFKTIRAYDGVEAIKAINVHKPDLVILDIMMPKKDGYTVCKEIAPLGIPVIMLTAKTETEDKLEGLTHGADDYITKPFDSRELILRVKAVLRRYKVFSDGSIVVNETAKRVLKSGEEIHLTPKEFDLLLILYNNPETVFTRDNLLDKVWGYDYFGDSRTVDIHVQRLRKKLGDQSSQIETVFGSGYRYRGNKK